MKPLGDQFADKIKRQLANFKGNGAKVIAEGIAEKMHENVDNGLAFDPNKFERSYQPRTIRDRRKKGFQVEYADLQRSLQRVKSTFVEAPDPDSAMIKFRSGGHIMFYHQWGKGFNPRRQLFPDVQGGGENAKGSGKLENPAEMPQNIVKKAHKLGTKLMNQPV